MGMVVTETSGGGGRPFVAYFLSFSPVVILFAIYYALGDVKKEILDQERGKLAMLLEPVAFNSKVP